MTHCAPASRPIALHDALRFALAGQPNVGKSTVFNLLTGLNQHVGNWPGKTVERRSGRVLHHAREIELVDLPGAYALTAASPEEQIARDYVLQERPDVVLVVISAASLERNLYLVAELLALETPLVLGLNMMDVARQQGVAIDVPLLAQALGIPVIPMVAAKNEGVHALLDAALQVAEEGPAQRPTSAEIRLDHRQVLAELERLLADSAPAGYPRHWVALKLLEGDAPITTMMNARLPPGVWAQVEALLRHHEDAFLAVASGRYAWIGQMAASALKRSRGSEVRFTHRFDELATHPFWGLVVLAAVLAGIFGLTYSVGGPLQRWIGEHVVAALAQGAGQLLAGGPAWVRGLVVDGVIGGVGTMLTFLPILALFFAAMGLLEDVGYMARAAFVMDRFMHGLGLHGKSFMPLFLGFGCNVPAVMGARIIEQGPSRILTILLAPLVPCTARLAVLTVLAQAFFPQQALVVTLSLTALPLIVLAALGALLRRVALRGESAAFIMEMPLYHRPNARTIGLLVWQRLLGFLQKAATVILGVSVVVWALATLPHGQIETSLLATLGRWLEPVGRLMGLGWRPLVALLTSFVAKENAVATLAVLYGVGEAPGALAEVLRAEFSSGSALAFLVAEMLFIPCASTLAVIRQETGSWRWVLADIALLATLTLLGGALAYRVGGWWL